MEIDDPRVEAVLDRIESLQLDPLPNTSAKVYRTPGDDFVHVDIEGPLNEVQVLAAILGQLGLIADEDIK